MNRGIVLLVKLPLLVLPSGLTTLRQQLTEQRVYWKEQPRAILGVADLALAKRRRPATSAHDERQIWG